MKNRNWVSLIDEETTKDTRKFVPLNENEVQEKMSIQDMKNNILLESIINLYKCKKQIYSEKSNTNNNILAQLQETQQWSDFKSQGLLIGELLGIDTEQVASVLDSLGQKLSELSGKSPDQTFEQLCIIQNQISRKDFAGLDDLDPKITTNDFLKLINKEQGDSVKMFIDLIETRKQRTLSSHLNSSSSVSVNTLNQLLSPIKKDIQSRDVLRPFVLLYNLGGKFQKHGNEIGPGEIALALSFNDCVLSGDQGDIKMNGKSVEIKGVDKGAMMTERVSTSTLPIAKNMSQYNPKSWNLIRKIQSKDNLTEKELKQAIKQFSTSKEYSAENHKICFVYLFGKLFANYSLHKTFDYLVGIQSNMSDFGNNRTIVITSPEVGENMNDLFYYNLGLEYLNKIGDYKFNVSVGSDSGGLVVFKLHATKQK